MALIKVVLLLDSSSTNTNTELPYRDYGPQLWDAIQIVIKELNFSCERVDLNKLDFQEHQSVNKFFNADIVIMDVTNPISRPTYMYHKGNRESVDCLDDIVLIQASGVENDNAIQDLKTTCKIKKLIIYRYDEKSNVFYDVTTQSTNTTVSLRKNLKSFLIETANNMQRELSARYLSRLEKRKNKSDDKNAESNYLWKEICDEILTEINQKYATPKLIAQLMYAFRDIQDYQSMIELYERCQQYEVISKKIKNNTMISYLTAFARSRRNQNDDRDKALEILKRICQTKRTENALSNDIICLSGRIYKDKYMESNCQDKESYEQALEWYRKGFRADPNTYAGINLLFLLSITIDNLKNNNETYKIIIQLNALLGKKGSSLKDLSDYWDVATYFELHAIQHDWLKACQGALHMYLRNPPIWYLKSTINNLKIVHQATTMRDINKSDEQSQKIPDDERLYQFWIEFFNDASNSNSTSSSGTHELPANLPILVCDNYAKNDEVTVNNIYVEAYLQLNFHTDNEPETLVIRIFEQQNRVNDLVKTIQINSIRAIINVKRDNRSVFLYARENSERFSSVELQIYFASAERRAVFNEIMSKYRMEPNTPELTPEFDLEFVPDPHGSRVAVGRGRFGKVYFARDRTCGKKYAVKEIPMRNPDYIEIFQNEIKNLSLLNHEHIVKYYGTAIDTKKKPSIFQIIMECVEGGSLAEHLSKIGHFCEESIRNYTRQILKGLQYLHEHRILHRDIKSANILLNSKGEIKIADFGASKRLAGFHRCKEETVGTLQYMCPDVVLVPPMGYGPEVDIWSVGCTVIEMATGKKPFHNVENDDALLFKLGNERKPPDIPSKLSDTAKDFLSKCFESAENRPSAKDLLNHPFIKAKLEVTRNTSFSFSSETSVSPTVLERSPSTGFANLEPSPIPDTQVSNDDYRRHELANILRDEENRETIISQWIELIEEKSETELLDIKKLEILLSGICSYLETGNTSLLDNALGEICDRTNMDNDIRIDLERSFYNFIKATNNVLSTRHLLPPHVLFALDNIIRRIAEYLVGLIRTDFIAADNNSVPSTPSMESQISVTNTRPLLSNSFDGRINGDSSNLYQQYRTLVDKNRKKMKRLIELETNNEIQLINLLNYYENNSSRTIKEFSSVETPISDEDRHSSSSSSSMIIENVSETQQSPMDTPSRGIKRSRSIFELEQEHERLLNEIYDNRLKVYEILNS